MCGLLAVVSALAECSRDLKGARLEDESRSGDEVFVPMGVGTMCKNFGWISSDAFTLMGAAICSYKN